MKFRYVDQDIADERERAHKLHGDFSMRAMSQLDLARLAILGEEYGEVCRVLNEMCHAIPGGTFRLQNAENLRTELVQLAAMASEWAAAFYN